ncbi:MAG: methylenetetrahydrofolate--tRNA-(uracil(54)-C(5))-methyltransferase (FADH(2)-oxidizing) TrmFO [Halofilum sp. (in: g-proteobacteria)]|nr:methylenetetrahydrofolate--tRNA-(uracil(54)-C(5))-methyltransferase (FADH(2)-oxidizing) TrmFO [Halofilum sp. (in: g-proteobacteria)]
MVGGGLAGSEAAWQAAERGLRVRLHEMRPGRSTEAHTGDRLAELVCSNSLGSDVVDRPSGLLKAELRRMGSLLLACADATAVPAGSALAVDRDAFAERVTERLTAHPNIELVRAEVTRLPQTPAMIASGPLTSPALSDALAALSGEEHLFFFDAISPIVSADSIDMDVAFRQSRWDRGDQEAGDYINCPLDRDEYEAFVDALLGAERIPLRSFEQAIESGVKAGLHRFFEGCLPVEIIAARGREALAYGPRRPCGLSDPRTGRRPHACVQLRQDDLAGTLYNLVGFQTNLTFPEQRRVFGLIPGLAQARWERLGQMHRNTFLSAPRLLRPTLQFRARDDLFCAGQLTGIEGYAGNVASGLLAGWNAARVLRGEAPLELPADTMLGALCHYIAHAEAKHFQPMKSNMGLLPALPPPQGRRRKRGKRERQAAHAERALASLEAFLAGADPLPAAA